jgi:putative aldouronate transport system permease protein
MNYSLFAVIALITLYPFWHTIVGSLIPFSEMAEKAVLLWPNTVTFAAYDQVLSSNLILRAYQVTIFATVFGTACSLLMTALAAYFFSRPRFPGQKPLFVAVIFTMLFQGGPIPLYVILSRYELIDTIWVYVFNHVLVNTFYLIIMKTSFQGLPQSIEDSAKMDGASDFTILFRIFIPMSLPVVATLTVFYSVDKWNDLYSALYFVTDTRKMNLQGVLFSMITGTETASMENIAVEDVAVVTDQLKMAAIIISTVPILVVYPFLQRYFVKGALIGAVKG